MSTNPFRRSSLKNPSAGGGSEAHPAASAPIGITTPGVETPPRLSVSTKGPNSAQKHVNFASPPAIPISPVSYPPSPESTRISPAYAIATPILPSPIDYSSAIQNNPFQFEAGTDENDRALEQALENARANNAVSAPRLETVQQNAVQNTLSRFMSAPKRPVAAGHERSAPQPSTPNRKTMDVDAFKRMLLTGEMGQTSNRDDGADGPTLSASAMNDSSSGTDTASTSQRSLFDHGPTLDDSPRSSDEIDSTSAEMIRQSIVPNDPVTSRKKAPPPPPVPRHGKSIRGDPPSGPADISMTSQAISAPSGAKKPPTPPLARRRSQHNTLPYTSYARTSSSSEVDAISAPSDGNTRAPPPPRPRRPANMPERRSSSDLPTTLEETDTVGPALPQSQKPSDTRPPPPRARNTAKPTNTTAISSPPPPPPRRGRASSRSSVDSLRPSEYNVPYNNTNEFAGREPSKVESDSRKSSSNSYGNDILADLAALQREVDEARSKANR